MNTIPSSNELGDYNETIQKQFTISLQIMLPLNTLNFALPIHKNTLFQRRLLKNKIDFN